MPLDDLIGYVASALVLLTFCQKRMYALRVTALLSNVAFLTYAARMNLAPVVVLHGLLLPINLFRLWTLIHAGTNGGSPSLRSRDAMELEAPRRKVDAGFRQTAMLK
ncbi:MAG: hypothetical protein ACTHJS_01380 [Xanthobacteraceae bacterium]